MWVERAVGGAVKGVYANRQPGYAEEELPDNDPEVVAFITARGAIPGPAVELTSRQFWTQLAIAGHISENEAINAMGADIPNVIKQYINTLPAGERFIARMFFEAATFQRHKRVATDMQACFALTPAAVDTFFQNAAVL